MTEALILRIKRFKHDITKHFKMSSRQLLFFDAKLGGGDEYNIGSRKRSLTSNGKKEF